LSTLAAMLERHGPTGGLDSFVEEIKARLPHAYIVCAPLTITLRVHAALYIIEAATKLLKICSWEAIRTDPGALSAALVSPVACRTLCRYYRASYACLPMTRVKVLGSL